MRTEPAARRPPSRAGRTDPLWGPGPPCATALACWSMGGGEDGRVCRPGCDALDDEHGQPAAASRSRGEPGD
ncbi:hypothetical protein E1265_05395 [Streptomyces sp. 8K308]|uniref:hypothetical protein n=1 Tax=Streptomyces sp. 8K308 TaxID=2530388 RepID=UPI001049BD4B|nr:hypothetical protein [Streptomyces sp. 8K308]TDC26044.1 hypothetical protein E1265_05395 [Streptomyces sp. 8K308]